MILLDILNHFSTTITMSGCSTVDLKEKANPRLYTYSLMLITGKFEKNASLSLSLTWPTHAKFGVSYLLYFLIFTQSLSIVAYVCLLAVHWNSLIFWALILSKS